jgi:hypothetical protein
MGIWDFNQDQVFENNTRPYPLAKETKPIKELGWE